MTDDLMTSDEAATYLKVSVVTLRKWAKKRLIPVVKVRRMNRYRRSDLDQWLKEQEG